MAVTHVLAGAMLLASILLKAMFLTSGNVGYACLVLLIRIEQSSCRKHGRRLRRLKHNRSLAPWKKRRIEKNKSGALVPVSTRSLGVEPVPLRSKVAAAITTTGVPSGNDDHP